MEHKEFYFGFIEERDDYFVRCECKEFFVRYECYGEPGWRKMWRKLLEHRAEHHPEYKKHWTYWL